MRSVTNIFEDYAKLGKKISSDVLASLRQIDDPNKLSDVISSHLSLKLADRQNLLELPSINKRLSHIFSFIEGEIGVIKAENKIQNRVKRQMEKTQREYYLNEQLKAIQKELGDADESGRDEVSEIEDKIKKAKLTPEAKEKADSELRKLRHMNPMSAEATVVRNYLDWLLDVPWKHFSRVKSDILHAESVLNSDHYGLTKVKERILEYLAVQVRTKKIKGPILCLSGPPGVGKTSLASSIAKATGRKFIRMSLGGVRDESEVRGHRRTYIGSMPGKIIQSMKKAGTSNPLFLLDEIDKMGNDFRGDPASALLEVLDPEQNNTFNDHYLEVDYDLSKVLFITTANSLNLPRPLLDRMEVIRLSGYTEDEKVEIARRHLISKKMKDHGLKKDEWSIDEDSLRDVIRYYTREAGVRNLDRELSNLMRKATKKLLQDPDLKSIAITKDVLDKYLGVRTFNYGQVEEKDLVGVVTGLAWTEMGGEILSIESAMSYGRGKVITTGKLGDVMQESITAAITYVRSNAPRLGITPSIFNFRSIHVHVPEGATPKDGPSAGVGMITSVVSLLTGIPVRRDVAMTGEITLRGRVLPIGGLKEKLLAALRSGIKTVIIPEQNKKDLSEIPDKVKKAINIIPVETVDEVLPIALCAPTVPIVWDEEEEKKMALANVKLDCDGKANTIRPH